MTSFRVAHHTRYLYGAEMTDGYTVTRLVPRPTEWQAVRESEIHLIPAASESDSSLDMFGNLVHQFGLHVPHAEMTVEAVSLVDLTERPPPIDDTPWEAVAEQLDQMTGALAVETGFFRSSSALVDVGGLGPDLTEIAQQVFAPGRGIVDAARALCERIFGGFEFDPGFSDVSTPLREVLDARRGVCQDFAHLAIGCLRSLGLAARYVSGYIETLPAEGQPRLVGADASHAWCSVWTPNAGWVDFDPTNGHLPAKDHITVAWGRDYADVTPVRGVMIGPSTSQQLDVSVDVMRV